MRGLLCLALFVAVARPAAAQEAETETVQDAAAAERDAEARALFERGMALTQRGQWSDALPLFDRAYAISDQPAALYNYAITLRALGRHVDALRAFEQLLALEINDAMREEATGMAREERGRLGALLVRAAGGTDVTLRIDARPIEVAAWPTRVAVDPGAHVVEATREGHHPLRVEREVGEGEEVEVALEFEPLPAVESVVAPPPPKRGWIAGVAVGAAAVVVGVVLAVVLSGGAEPLQPRAGTVEVPL